MTRFTHEDVGPGREANHVYTDTVTNQEMGPDTVLHALTQTYQQAGFPWQPIADYDPTMGRVLVWLSWHRHQQYQGMVKVGTSIVADRHVLTGVAVVWVNADRADNDGLPLEMYGKMVTHFCQVRGPVE